VIGLIFGLVEHTHRRAHPETTVHAFQPRARLVDRLAPENRGELISMSMQDHYVQVMTTLGIEMILLRFSDALEEVREVDGIRTHRSHWVARLHISTIGSKRGRTFAILSDGRHLPVNATYQGDVEQAANLS